jgi:hypothetical protein
MRSMVEGVRLKHGVRDRSPSTTLRAVPLPLRVRRLIDGSLPIGARPDVVDRGQYPLGRGRGVQAGRHPVAADAGDRIG